MLKGYKEGKKGRNIKKFIKTKRAITFAETEENV